jgi:hypothetical protein
LILDNLQVHKRPAVGEWLKKHPPFPLHTDSRQLAEPDRDLFSILGRRLLKRGIFTSKEGQTCQIMEFIAKDDRTAKPFAPPSHSRGHL